MRRTLWILIVIALVQQRPLCAQQLPQAVAVGNLAGYFAGSQYPDDLFGRLPFRRLEHYVYTKATKVDDQLRRQTENQLKKLRRLEAGIRKRLSRIDSPTILLTGLNTDSGRAQHLLQAKAGEVAAIPGGTRYLPNLDSLQTALQFLAGQCATGDQRRLANALEQVEELRKNLGQAEVVKKFMQQRRQMIQELLGQYKKWPTGLSRRYQAMQQEAILYTQQVEACRDLLGVPDKLLSMALDKLRQLPAFLRFVAQNSELAGLFNVPAGYGSAALSGLQTRSEVQQLLQTQLAGAGPNAQQLLQQNIQVARGELQQLKEKAAKWGVGGADIEMPNYKSNTQRTKTFWRRIEYGANLQSARSNTFYPTTTDIGLSAGYKLSDQSIIGVGASYKLGWGKDIGHIDMTSEGASVRSFLDVNIKASFFLSGGFECNYQPLAYAGVLTTQQREQTEAWQQSGLIGISKIVAVKSKLFRKTKLQLLWDMLSYRQTPRAQALKFRVGYSF